MRSVALGAIATTLAACFVACTPAPTSGSGAVQVRAGQDATLTAGSSLEVSIPGTSIKGEGEVTAAAVKGPDGVAGWSIEMSGAELVGPAEIRFATKLKGGEPLPVYTSTSDGVNYEVAENVAQDGDVVVVTTTHFSNWFELRWNELMEKARAGLDRIYRDAGKPPSCNSEDAVRAAGYSVKSDSGSSVYWCLGEGTTETAALKAVNGRGYTVAAEHTPGMTVTAGEPNDLVGIFASLIKEVPSKRGNTVTLVGPGSTIEYDVAGDSDMGVRFKPSVPGYLVTAGQYAVDTLAMILPFAGKGGLSKAAVAKLFQWESCIAGFSSMVTSEVETVTQASNVFNDAVGTVLGCMDGALKRAGLAFFGTAAVAGLAWLVAGVRTALNGFGAAAATMASPEGYTIYITPPKPDRWLIDATGVGPVKIGASSDQADAAAEKNGVCSTSKPWGVIWWPDPDVVGIMVLGEPADDAPATRTGVTLGSNASELVPLGATSRTWEMMPDYSIYTWKEDGQKFAAMVESSSGIIVGLSVGQEFFSPDYC